MKTKAKLSCLTVQHLRGILFYTVKVDPNSQILFSVFAIIHSIASSWESNFKTTRYISWSSLLHSYGAELRKIHCPRIFLQNRSKCSQCLDVDTHVHMCTRTFTLVLDQFTFLPPFFSHLHRVRVTPEQNSRPCGRIRKWSISENTVE